MKGTPDEGGDSKDLVGNLSGMLCLELYELSSFKGLGI
jgi:hypothetical protein